MKLLDQEIDTFSYLTVIDKLPSRNIHLGRRLGSGKDDWNIKGTHCSCTTELGPQTHMGQLTKAQRFSSKQTHCLWPSHAPTHTQTHRYTHNFLKKYIFKIKVWSHRICLEVRRWGCMGFFLLV